MQPFEIAQACDALMQLQVRRKFFIGLTNRQMNATRALVRRRLGWRFYPNETPAQAKERLRINAQAERIVKALFREAHAKVRVLAKESGGDAAVIKDKLTAADRELADRMAVDVSLVAEAIIPCEVARLSIEKDMRRLAKSLPVYKNWAQHIVGLNAGMVLAVIIGEAGNFSDYPGVFPEEIEEGVPHPQAGEPRPARMGPDALNKRFGLAPFAGKALSRWRVEGGLSADQWEEAGYSPRRRAEIFSMTEPLFRAQAEHLEKVMDDGSIRPPRPPLEPYGGAYYRRRAHTVLTHPEWKPMQSHMDGLRVMSQKLLADLWREWRRAEHPVLETACRVVPAAEEFV